MWTSGLFPVSIVLAEVCLCLEFWCGWVGLAISSGWSFWLHSRPLLDWLPLVGTSCCTCARFQFEGFLGWSSMLTHWESFCTCLRLACRWRPDSFLVRVHAVLGAGWLYCHSALEWGLLRFPRFYTPACCRVGRCCSFQPRSSKITWREMWRRSPATTYVRLAHCSGLLRSWSPLVRGFLWIGCRQRWFGFLWENGSSHNVPYSARIVDRSHSSWSTSSQKYRDRSFCCVCRRHLIDYSSMSTVVGLPDVSVESSFGRFSRLAFSNGWIDRSTPSSCGFLSIHGWWVPSIFAECPLWGLGRSFRPDSTSDNCWRKSCKIPPSSLVGSSVARGLLLLLQSWSLTRKVLITPNWRCSCRSSSYQSL